MPVPQDEGLCVFCRRHPVEPEWRPFCSKRCTLQDLARWADGTYAIPGEPLADPGRKPDNAADSEDANLMTDTLTITDNRTGKKYELPIQDGTIRAMDLRQIKTGADDFGLMTYDPAFMNTANCRSAITYIDGDKGILLYRGLPDRAAGGGERLPRNRLPDPLRRAADRVAAAGVDPRDHPPYDAAREHQEAHGGLPVRRAPDGDLPQHGRRDVAASIPRRRTSSKRRRGCVRRTG